MEVGYQIGKMVIPPILPYGSIYLSIYLCNYKYIYIHTYIHIYIYIHVIISNFFPSEIHVIPFQKPHDMEVSPSPPRIGQLLSSRLPGVINWSGFVGKILTGNHGFCYGIWGVFLQSLALNHWWVHGNPSFYEIFSIGMDTLGCKTLKNLTKIQELYIQYITNLKNHMYQWFFPSCLQP